MLCYALGNYSNDVHGNIPTKMSNGPVLNQNWPKASSFDACTIQWYHMGINTLRLRQNGQYFADNIFKDIFFNENVWISIKNSLKFVPKGLISKIPALVQIMAWCWPGDKPLSEPMMVILPKHICITWSQWIKAPYLTSHLDLKNWNTVKSLI